MKWELLTFLLWGAALGAAGVEYNVPYFVPPPLIDGNVTSDSAWERASEETRFFQYDMPEPMPEKTVKMRIGYDSIWVYIALVVTPADEIRTTRTDYEDVWNDDCVEIFVKNPRLSGWRHFVFNFAGARFQEYRLGQNACSIMQYPLDTWMVASKRFAGGPFEIEARLAWEALDLVPSPGMVFGFNLGVCSPENGKITVWSPEVNSFQNPASFGRLKLGDWPGGYGVPQDSTEASKSPTNGIENK